MLSLQKGRPSKRTSEHEDVQAIDLQIEKLEKEREARTNLYLPLNGKSRNNGAEYEAEYTSKSLTSVVNSFDAAHIHIQEDL